MRSHSSSDLKGACQEQSTHVASRGSSQKMCVSVKGSAFSTQIIIYRHCITSQKLDFTHHLIWVSSFSLPLRVFGFSSPVIVIVKSYFII